jgi:hypothetical protein
MKSNIAIVKSPKFSFDKENDLFSTHYSDVFPDKNSCLDYLIPFLLKSSVERIGNNYNRGKARKSFHKNASWYILRLIYDYNSNIKNPTKTSDIKKILETTDGIIDYTDTIRQLFDISFKYFKKSDFKAGNAERDFLKSKDAYKIICSAINKTLQRKIKSMFS